MSVQEERRLVYHIQTVEFIWVSELVRRFKRDRLTLRAAAERNGVLELLDKKLEATRGIHRS